MHIKLRLDWRHPAIKKLVRLSGWTAGYVVANQIAFLIVTQLAQRSAGGFTAYSTMYIFFQLPYGLLAVTVMTTVSPELARDIAHRDRDAFRRRVRDGLWLIILLMVPASIVMAIFAEPIAKLAGFVRRHRRRTRRACGVLVRPRRLLGVPLFHARLLCHAQHQDAVRHQRHPEHA